MDTYKITTIVLALLLIGTLIYFMVYRSNDEVIFRDINGNPVAFDEKAIEELNTYNSIMDVDQEKLDKWTEDLKEIDSVAVGKPLNVKDARERLVSFTEWNRKFGNFIREIKPNGFAFGNDRIRQMLHDIDSTNSRLRERGSMDSIIYGVRINLSHTFGDGKPTMDVMFVPIMKNGNNFFNLTKNGFLDEGPKDMLLNTSSPCPEICNGTVEP